MQYFSKSVSELVCTFFYVGKLPKAPGTFGTIAAVPIVYALSFLDVFSYTIFTTLFVMFSIVACSAYERHFKSHDPGEIVIDEVAGYLVAMAWIPFSLEYAFVGFAVFRMLDIYKPFPIGYLDKKIPGGLGVVIDDIAAGLLTNVLLRISLIFVPIN